MVEGRKAARRRRNARPSTGPHLPTPATARYRPWEIAWCGSFPDKQPALDFESTVFPALSVLHAEGGNLVNGWAFVPTPEMRPVFKNAEVLVVRLEAAPSASTPR